MNKVSASLKQKENDCRNIGQIHVLFPLIKQEGQLHSQKDLIIKRVFTPFL